MIQGQSKPSKNLHCFGSTFFGFCLTEQGEIGPDLFRKACEFDLEGLVSEHRDRSYRGGRRKHWIRVENRSHPSMARVLEFFRWQPAQHWFGLPSGWE